MATSIQKIRRDFFLKALFDESIPVVCLMNRAEYTLSLEQPVTNHLVFKASQPVEEFKPKDKVNFHFNYHEQVMVFSAEVVSARDFQIITTVPESLYQNLSRGYARVGLPRDLKLKFTLLGEHYLLDYPKIAGYEDGGAQESLKNTDGKSLDKQVDEMYAWIKEHSSGYKLVLFKGNSPACLEEKIVIATGKSLFMPSPQGGLPKTDPSPQKRIITDEMFKDYLAANGVSQSLIAVTCEKFIKFKTDRNLLSDAWVPVVFKNHVIGCVNLWINTPGKPPFDFKVLDTLYTFTKILSCSMEVNGYFDYAKNTDKNFDGNVFDISASGLLFAYPHSSLSDTMNQETPLQVTVTLPDRSITMKAEIVRHYRDSSQDYFGCRFLDLTQEDQARLFEYIYGKPFTESDNAFLQGHV